MVNKPIRESFISGEPAVAVTIGHDFVDRLSGRFRSDLSEALLHVVDEVRLSLDVTGRSTKTTVGLVQQHPSVGGEII